MIGVNLRGDQGLSVVGAAVLCLEWRWLLIFLVSSSFTMGWDKVWLTPVWWKTEGTIQH